jgi:hypothetical protein
MNGTFMRRAFRFRASQQPIADYVFERILDGQQGTTVLLKGVEPYFSQGIPLKLETLADRIIEHFMEFFSTTKDWLIVLKDDTDDENVIDLFRRHSDIYEAAASVEPVKVGTIDFSIRHMRKKRAEGSKHSMTLCGGGREVTRVNLVKYLPELTSKIQDDSGAYYYHGLVSGRYLDERLNEARTAFEVPDQEDMATAEEPAIRQIIKQCIGVIERHLSAELDILREANLRAVEQHIDKSAPYYRFLKHYARDELGRIPASLDGREKDMRLYMIKTDLEAKARRETDSILRQIQEEPEYFKDHVAEFEQRVGLINDINKSDLARYIVKRKMILEILKQVISRRKDGTFCLEKAVHELVFPLRHTSDDVPYEKHNLWVIDERLAFHNYLSSDLPLSNTPGIDCDSREEPDIIVFDYPVSLAEGTPPFKSISIIEFKKPMKTTFSEKDNPLRQVMRYIRKIQSRSNDPVSGRPYHVTDAVRFYCYVICEISQDIIDTARELTLAQLPDGEGYIGYNPYYRAYFDVFSFERLLGDAEKRNEMMFEKLGL